ncbi:cell wall hydrolase [Ferrovibrio sp.]|uniref:cell wall hydrolase n=2 Tax=Ferrovibrio sp. TaxID=1917215 RepID=UPI0025BCCEF4|nr:cell wall hydrolase [Ferrovibrio sp.]MBX3454830.1 cell wall hydrolase [Ferrovibrio sp.]
MTPARQREQAGHAAREREIDVLARTLWGEARGEGEAGMAAVAAVIVNRARRPGWWGRDIVEVCLRPWQFSCWNAGDPNRDKLLRVGAIDNSFAAALRIARLALAGALPDPTHGATHYHAADILPGWARGHEPCARIGRHVFYDHIA